jgi:hypothetical protein
LCFSWLALFKLVEEIEILGQAQSAPPAQPPPGTLFKDYDGIVHAKNLNPSIVLVTLPRLMAIQQHKFTLCNHSFEFGVLAGVRPGHALNDTPQDQMGYPLTR